MATRNTNISLSFAHTHTHTQIFDPADITDSSSTHSDDTTSGGCGGGTESCSGRTSRGARLSGEHASSTRRRKNALNAKERNLRRLESNERERMRMHSLNDAFQVSAVTRECVCVCMEFVAERNAGHDVHHHPHTPSLTPHRHRVAQLPVRRAKALLVVVVVWCVRAFQGYE